MKLAVTGLCVCLGLVLVSLLVLAQSDEDVKKPQKKKDIRDFNDVDIERLFDEWEENDDDEKDPDDLPEHLRPPPKIDLSDLDPSNPDDMMKVTKKGRTLMMFVSVSGSPTEKETEDITGLWQGSLFNANYEVTRYVVGENRAIFMVKDGSTAWEIKDFLIQQDRCEDVTIDSQVYHGAGSKNKNVVEDVHKKQERQKQQEQESSKKEKVNNNIKKTDKVEKTSGKTTQKNKVEENNRTAKKGKAERFAKDIPSPPKVEL